MADFARLLLEIEVYLEKEELRKLGLDEEEIEGYFSFSEDGWLTDIKNKTEESE